MLSEKAKSPKSCSKSVSIPSTLYIVLVLEISNLIGDYKLWTFHVAQIMIVHVLSPAAFQYILKKEFIKQKAV